MTEDSLLAAIRSLVADGSRKIVLGIGDDAAAWRPSRSNLSVITTDALVEGVHFTRGGISARDVGHRALASNLSDIAAMGARPVLATVALGVSPELEEEWILDCYRGMAGLAARHGTAIAGGDIVGAGAIVLSITVVGEVSPSRLKRRSGARPGDVVAVTGMLGASRAGLEVLRGASGFSEAVRRRALAAHRTPVPRLAEGRWLAASRSVHAMMDLSDGLSTDLRRLCAASSCAAQLVEVPIDPAAGGVARGAGAEPLEYALHGGEDFELLAAVDARAFGYLARRFEQRFGRPLYRAGEFISGGGVYLGTGLAARELSGAGWDHLRSTR